MGDWRRWHEGYDDGASPLSRRLLAVQQRIRAWADEAPHGPLRVISMCAGQGLDLAGALTDHPRHHDVGGLLVELDEDNAAIARRLLRSAGLSGMRVHATDAADLTAYASDVPADLLLACGIFGNVSDDDVRRTIMMLPSLIGIGAHVIWTRHRRAPDLTPVIREWFADSGFIELDFTSPGPDAWAVGAHSLAEAAAPYAHTARPLFRFIR